MDDLKAMISKENVGLERAIGKHGCGKMNLRRFNLSNIN